MRLFLATHVHWLWSLLHTFMHPFSLQTLLLFVLVGALQILVAAEGGALTVEALPTEPRRKRFLKAEFRFLGLMLFAATVWTGVLNDQSEKASDGRADDLKTALTELSNSAVTAAQLHAEITKLPARAPSTPAQEKLNSQFQQAIDQTKELARRYSTLPSATAGPVSEPPIPAPSTQLPPLGAIAQPQSFHPVPTRTSVQADIEKTLNRIADIDRTADRYVQGTLSSVRGLYVNNYSGNQASKDAAFRSAVPLLLEITELARTCTAEVAVVAGAQKYAGLDGKLQIIEDRWPGEGPLGGIITALQHTAVTARPARWNLILSCDMPFLTAEWLQFLVTHARESNKEIQVILPHSAHGPEPLCACYRTNAADALKNVFDRGVRKVTQALKELCTEVLDESVWKRFDSAGRLFWNMNTPADFEEAQRLWQTPKN